MTPGDIQLPLVHLGGSGRASLVKQYRDAITALEAALESMQHASPNARDYYPLGEGAFERARAEHRARTESVTAARDALVLIWEHLSLGDAR